MAIGLHPIQILPGTPENRTRWARIHTEQYIHEHNPWANPP